MKLFKNFKAPAWIKAGTKKDSLFALILSILLLCSTPLMIYKANLVIVPLLLFFVTFYEMFRGLQSDSPKLAKIARIILIIAAIVVIALCVFVFFNTLRLVTGGKNG